MKEAMSQLSTSVQLLCQDEAEAVEDLSRKLMANLPSVLLTWLTTILPRAPPANQASNKRPLRRRQGPSLPAAAKAVRRRAPGLLAIGETLSWRAEEKLRQAHLRKCKRIHQGAFQLLLISRNSPPRKLGVRRRLKQNGQHWAAQSPKVKINRSGVGMWKVTMTQMKTFQPTSRQRTAGSQ